MESASEFNGLTINDIRQFPFIYKLWILINSNEDLINWSASGREILLNLSKLHNYLINVRSIFKEKKPDTFLKQLSGFGFVRILHMSTSSFDKCLLCLKSQYFVRQCPGLLSILNDENKNYSDKIKGDFNMPGSSKIDCCSRKIGFISKFQKSRIVLDTDISFDYVTTQLNDLSELNDLNNKELSLPSDTFFSPHENVSNFPKITQYAGFYGNINPSHVKDFFGEFLPIRAKTSQSHINDRQSNTSYGFGICSAENKSVFENTLSSENLTLSSSLEQTGGDNMAYNIVVSLNDSNNDKTNESKHAQYCVEEKSKTETEYDEFKNYRNSNWNSNSTIKKDLEIYEIPKEYSDEYEDATILSTYNATDDSVRSSESSTIETTNTSNHLENNLMDVIKADTEEYANLEILSSSNTTDSAVLSLQYSNIETTNLSNHLQNNSKIDTKDKTYLKQNDWFDDARKLMVQLNPQTDEIISRLDNDDEDIVPMDCIQSDEEFIQPNKRKHENIVKQNYEMNNVNEEIIKIDGTDNSYNNFCIDLSPSDLPQQTEAVLTESDYSKIIRYLEQNDSNNEFVKFEMENCELTSKQLEQIFVCSDANNLIIKTEINDNSEITDYNEPMELDVENYKYNAIQENNDAYYKQSDNMNIYDQSTIDRAQLINDLTNYDSTVNESLDNLKRFNPNYVRYKTENETEFELEYAP